MSARIPHLVLITDEAQPVGERVEELVAGVLYLAVEIRCASDAGELGRLQAEARRLGNLTKLLEEELQDRVPPPGRPGSWKGLY